MVHIPFKMNAYIHLLTTRVVLLATLVVFTPVSFAKVNVLACEAEWAALAHAIGRNKVNIYAATTYQQDPHHIQARPSLIAQARKADLLVCSGADLEIGWLPVLLRKSGNPKIQLGKPGYFMATEQVELLEEKNAVDRSHGDVHAAGNPHIHLDPSIMLKVGAALANRLAIIDKKNELFYLHNYQKLDEQFKQQLDKWQKIIAQLKQRKVISHHNSWVYLFAWLDMQQVATLEPKPGLPPTTKHLTKLLKLTKTVQVSYILAASYQSKKASQWLGNKADIAQVYLPYSPKNWQEKDALINWYSTILHLLVAPLQNK
jgi:zinc/manganese transport system substrate-binding protein